MYIHHVSYKRLSVVVMEDEFHKRKFQKVRKIMKYNRHKDGFRISD